MHVRMILLPVVLLTLPANAGVLCGHNVVSIEQMVADIGSQAGGRVVLDTADFIAVEDPARMIIWTFAKPKDGRFPAYICRRVVRKEDRIDVELRALCQGPKTECDALIASALDEQQKATRHLRQ